MIQGVIKPMPEYLVHYRAGIEFPKEGRRFLVDGEEAKKASEAARKKGDPQYVKPVIFHEVDGVPGNGAPFGKQNIVQRQGVIVDQPGKPLVMDEYAFGYIKDAFGKQLVCEPLDGGTEPLEVQELRDENGRLRSRVAELEAAAKKK